MVTGKKKLITAAAAGCLALALAGISSLTMAGSPALAAEDKTEDIMHGPDVPPKGMRYDEWKGFQYTTDREFDLRTFWTITMYDHSKPESHDLFRDPENVEDAVLKIVDAKSEPVGGEMKLRSGGFVDITVELYWTGTMNGVESTSELLQFQRRCGGRQHKSRASLGFFHGRVGHHLERAHLQAVCKVGYPQRLFFRLE